MQLVSSTEAAYLQFTKSEYAIYFCKGGIYTRPSLGDAVWYAQSSSVLYRALQPPHLLNLFAIVFEKQLDPKKSPARLAGSGICNLIKGADAAVSAAL